jgi:YHS domain-containing protein
MVIDPVCHMLIHQEKAAATLEHKGEAYYFCSPRCQNDFLKDPAYYAGCKTDDTDGHCGSCQH